jgi:Ca2+:H+ antiporter
VPLAWLIGESTEQLAEHTGPGIGGFLNATFGNAPELIVALIAIHQGLFEVVRGSITGSVVSNLLLVFGLTMVTATGSESVDRKSLVPQLATIVFAALLFLIPGVPGWNGNPNRHTLMVASVPIAAVLLAVYVATNVAGLRRHSAMDRKEARAGSWRIEWALVALGIGAVATAFVSEALVDALTGFGKAVGLSQFFVAVVIVALVGNAAEHGGAIVVATRGKFQLASEIAITSSAQVAVFVAPAVMLLSLLSVHHLTLAFRPVELATIGLATAVVVTIVLVGRTTRREGFALVAAYAAAVVAYGFS